MRHSPLLSVCIWVLASGVALGAGAQGFQLGGAPASDLPKPLNSSTKPADPTTQAASPGKSEPVKPGEGRTDPANPDPAKADGGKPESAKPEAGAGATPTPADPNTTGQPGAQPASQPAAASTKPVQPWPPFADLNGPTGTAATQPNGRKPTSRPEVFIPVVDFPPGLFTDGQQYRIGDLRGKVVVLFFYDPLDSRTRATVPHRNAVVQQFQGKPVIFFGVQADTIGNVVTHVRRLNLQMPAFADTLGVMMNRYRVTLNAAHTWQVVIIEPDGKLVHDEMSEAVINKALEKARWKYRDREAFDPKLDRAIAALEIGDYAAAMRQLTPVLLGRDKKAAESAKALQAILRTEADAWKAQAEQLAPNDPMGAYDLYARIATCFPGTDLARSVIEPARKLEMKVTVRNELQARVKYNVLCEAVARDQQIEKWDAAGYCEEIISAHPGTQTSEKLIKYLDDLGKVRERNANNTNKPNNPFGRR